MDRTLRLRKGIRTSGLLSLLCFVSMGVVSVCAVFADPPPNERIRPLYLALVFGLFWGAMASLSTWMLLAYWRESLTVTDEQVMQRGVVRTKAVYFNEIEALRWRLGGAGRIRLQTPSTKMTIYLESFEPLDRLWLVRHLQGRIPASLQERWELFCCKVAVPMRQYEAPRLTHPDPRHVILTRKRWALYFIPTTLFFAVVGLVLSWTLQHPRLLIAPAAPLLLWGVLYFSTPRQGILTTRISAEPGRSRFLFFLLPWTCVGLGANFVLAALKRPIPQAIAWAIVGGIIWFAVLFYRAIQFDRQRQQRDKERVPTALKDWDEGLTDGNDCERR